MEKDPAVVARLAAERADENDHFRAFIKWYCRLSDGRLNALARRLGAAAAGEIHCLDCGACCRSIVVPLEDAEIATLAAHRGLGEPEFRRLHVRWVDQYEQAIDGEPCPFQEGHHCTVYECRPEPCRGYPYIGGDIRSHSLAVLERAATCPIVFEMLERLKTELGFRRWRRP